MLDNYQILKSMTGLERAKLVKSACRKLKSFGCDVVEVHVSFYTKASTITFNYKNEQHQICALNVRETWSETKVEVPSIIIKEIKQT